MYLLPTLAAGLVRCFHIDRLDKLSEGIGGQLRESTVPLYPLNKLLYILCLLFLFMYLLLQNYEPTMNEAVRRVTEAAATEPFLNKRRYGKRKKD